MKQLSDNELLRYSRTIFLDSVDYAGQIKLKNAKVLIVGVGGLGSVAALYLASSGVGQLYLADEDKVELSNLARQILYRQKDIGKDKSQIGKKNLKQINAQVKIHPLKKADKALLSQIVPKVDVVLDCSDNFATRFLINQFCSQYQKPLVSGAAIRFEGQIASFRLDLEGSACYQCLYPKNAQNLEENCADCGVFPPLLGIVGSMQAAEAMKIILNIGEDLAGRVLLLSAFDMRFRELKLSQDDNCAVCQNRKTLKKQN